MQLELQSIMQHLTGGCEQKKCCELLSWREQMWLHLVLSTSFTWMYQIFGPSDVWRSLDTKFVCWICWRQ